MAREVFTSQDSAEVGYYKSILDEAGLITYIRNEYTDNPAMSGATFLPTLCVVEDADYDQAVELLKACRPPEITGAIDWTCPTCSEKNPSNFEVCWKCSTPKPSSVLV